MLLDTGLRGGAIALFCLLALNRLPRLRASATARYVALLDLCAIAYLVESAPSLAAQQGWILPVRLVSMAAPGAFVMWSDAAFNEAFVPGWLRWWPFAAMLVLGAGAVAADTPFLWHVTQAAALLSAAGGLYHILSGRSQDLIEGRPTARLILACAIGAGIVLATVAGALRITALPSVSVVLVLALAAALLRPRIDPPAAEPPAAATPPAMTRDDAALADRLRRLMEQDRLYREGGLTVATLADQLGVPEYRLRRLINQALGHRNFVTYVNAFRLAEAQSALADPGQVRVPVLTIALDAGFQSIGPFNRAFKALTGQTPTEYRRRCLGNG